MTKQEAILAMQRGQKVTHRYFDDNEYVYLKDGKIYTEDGASISPYLFWLDRPGEAWETDWSIFKEETK